MNRCRGIQVTRLEPASPLYTAGVRIGDRIMAINGEEVGDELDLRFYAAASAFSLDIERRGRAATLEIVRREGSSLGVEFRPDAIRRCTNRCIFCFIDQMPPGLRSSLYIKDEDLTHSFLNGNYVTLAGIREADLQKIQRLGLSPLFISVHATDPQVRQTMLGNCRSPAIMDQLRLLRRNGTQLHTQIVVCPGYNDGAVLKDTLRDLLSLRESLLSVAVVPVGLTRFRTLPLEPVDAAAAAAICTLVSTISDGDKEKFGARRVFLADELFLRAGWAIPSAAYYEEYPQIENGVGLIRQLLDSWKAAKRRYRRRPGRSLPEISKNKYFLLTSVSAFPFLSGIAREAARLRPGATFEAVAICNRFFGETVTVAGLIAAADVLRALSEAKRTGSFTNVLLPGAMFNYAGYTLDGYSAARIGKESGTAVTVIDSIEALLGL
jgi:putative radical SAM enzyme (TIGR03279 family)